MSQKYRVECSCGAVRLSMTGTPKVRAHCHCEDCRDLLNIPYHSVVAWEAADLKVELGEENTAVFNHPTLKMTRVFCTKCGDTLYNTNAMDWKVTSQHLIRK
ncbi:MAG: GFA family protein, partial [Clostridia bacterium]|nr:GFA family protein [Clostridia bacterium]